MVLKFTINSYQVILAKNIHLRNAAFQFNGLLSTFVVEIHKKFPFVKYTHAMENNTDIKSGIKAYVDMVKSYLMDSEKFLC